MFINVYSLSIVFSLAFLVAVTVLIRRNRLLERYSLLWILMSIVLLVLASTPIFIEAIAVWLDIKNPPSLLFLFGLVYLLVYNLHITVVMSGQSEKITSLAQEVALLKQKLGEAEKQINK